MHYQTKSIVIPDFRTICGRNLYKPKASYSVYGNFNNKKRRALFFHGFSSNSELHTWWEKFRLDKVLDYYNIICINSLGSSHGTTGPESINPATGVQYLRDFPAITVQDTVNFAVSVLKQLEIDSVDLAVGCSLGGMQVLDMFLRYPKTSKKFISVAGTPVPYMTKLINLAQARLIDEVSYFSERSALESALGLSRFFFRLTCTTEEALEILNAKRANKNNCPLEILEAYFVEDNLKFQTQFSPYSNSLYMKLIAKFSLHNICSIAADNKNPKLIMISIENDQFIPEQYVKNIFNTLRENGYSIALRHFNTKFGHEAWIVDGEKFYEFLSQDLFCN